MQWRPQCLLWVSLWMAVGAGTAAGATVTTTGTATEIAPTGNGSYVSTTNFVFTFRAFSKPTGQWVTQVHLNRSNIDGGAVPTVRASVDRTSNLYAPGQLRIVAEVAVAPPEVDEVTEGMYVFMSLRLSWLQARSYCELLGMHLALPTNATLSWLARKQRGLGYASPTYMGVSSLSTDGPVISVFGDEVRRGGEALVRRRAVCGAGMAGEAGEVGEAGEAGDSAPPRLIFTTCEERLPFMCDGHEHLPRPTGPVDVSVFLED